MTAHGAVAAGIVVDRAGFRLDVALEVAPGERVAVMGPSGAGKSTLLSTLAGFTRLDAGSIRLGARVLAASGRPALHVAPMERGAVLLGQDPLLFPHLTAAQNIAFGLRARGRSRPAAADVARAWLDRVGMACLGDRRPAELSGGQQQRVALARALVTGPELVLLDEPLSSLDAETVADIRALLAEHLIGTTILVTHDAVDAAALADRLVIIEGGRVTQDGPVREVLQSPATGFAAALAGVVRVEGIAREGVWQAGPIRIPAPGLRGPAAAVFRPDAATIELVDRPSTPVAAIRDAEGFRAVSWVARIVRLDQGTGSIRVQTDAVGSQTAAARSGVRVAVDVPWDAYDPARLKPGAVVRVTVTPGSVRFLPG